MTIVVWTSDTQIWKLILVKAEGIFSPLQSSSEAFGLESPPPHNMDTTGQPSASAQHTESLHDEITSNLINLWKNFHEFLSKCYGLSDFSTPNNHGPPKTWSLRLGCKVDTPSVNMVNFYESVVNNNWPHINVHEFIHLWLHHSSWASPA
jgi:hypothetical protein